MRGGSLLPFIEVLSNPLWRVMLRLAVAVEVCEEALQINSQSVKAELLRELRKTALHELVLLGAFPAGPGPSGPWPAG